MTVHTFDQRSEQWKAIRVGRLGSSSAHEMLAEIKSGEAAARRNLRVRLTLERLTGRSQESGYLSQAMQDGIDREAECLGHYEAVSGELVSRVGYMAHDELMAGFSPDGLIGDDGFCEAKCPTPAIHLEYVKCGVVPSDYYKQILHGMWLSGRAWCDWVSFNPDFPEPLRLKIVRVHRNQAAIQEYERKAVAFLQEVDREVEAIRTISNLSGALRASAVPA